MAVLRYEDRATAADVLLRCMPDADLSIIYNILKLIHG
jgi:hypothetical protein